MPMDRSRYPANWRVIVEAVRVRSGDRCEWCDIPNGTKLVGRKGKPYSVVLTTAHLGTPYPDGRPGDKHDKHDCRMENLAHLCQRCHLWYDLEDHIQHARETRQRRQREAALASGQMSLFE